jgi:hypothetical protein
MRRGLKRLLIVGFGVWCLYGLATIPGKGVPEIYESGLSSAIEQELNCRKAGNPAAQCKQQTEESRKHTNELAAAVRSDSWTKYGLFVAGYPVLIFLVWVCYRIIRWVVTGFSQAG